MTRKTRRTESNGLSRRAFLGASTATTLALAGCLGDGGGGDGGGGDGDATDDGSQGEDDGSPPDEGELDGVPALPRVENPPDAVYVPSHRNAMVPLEPVEAGEYEVRPMLTYPHRFWLVTGSDREEVTPSGGGVHLMIAVRDAESGAILPVDMGAEVRVTHDGDLVDRRAPWPMISQTMGFHFGDNVGLAETGTYAVEAELNPITNVRKTGAFADRFETGGTVSFEFEFDREFQRAVVDGVEYLDEERWGERDALEPMMGGMDEDTEDGTASDAQSGLLPASAYPGRSLGTPTSGDATFVVRYLDETRLTDGKEGYLLVSPRTPYNRVPLADMALSVTGPRDAELVQTLDGDLGHHYGVALDLSAGDALELVVESPPQVARHRGYETAFLDMPPVEIEIPDE